jgi:hypothetical protein
MRERVGSDLHPNDKRHVLNSYLYRMTIESVARWPRVAEYMRATGYRMPIRSDADWLASTYFRVRRDGRLDGRVNACRTEWK